MRKFIAICTAVALAASILGVPSAVALSKTRAEQAVVQRVKSRYLPLKGAFAKCHRLTGSRFGCTYTYTSYSQSWCEGGATVRQFSDGLSVTLSRPRAVIDNGGC